MGVLMTTLDVLIVNPLNFFFLFFFFPFLFNPCCRAYFSLLEMSFRNGTASVFAKLHIIRNKSINLNTQRPTLIGNTNPL